MRITLTETLQCTN